MVILILNHSKDAIAYRAAGFKMGKIFIVNPGGTLCQFNNTYEKTYVELNEMVDSVFPDTNGKYIYSHMIFVR